MTKPKSCDEEFLLERCNGADREAFRRILNRNGGDAFELRREMVRKRLSRGRLTVIDATNVQPLPRQRTRTGPYERPASVKPPALPRIFTAGCRPPGGREGMLHSSPYEWFQPR